MASDRHEKREREELELSARGISRRTFLKGSGAAVAVAGVAAVAGCDPNPNGATPGDPPGITEPPPGAINDPTPPPPAQIPGGTLRFFTPKEAKALDALTARIMPGDPSDPGAREAGVVWYIDGALAQTPTGFNQPIYHEPPFAQPYEGDAPPSGTFEQTLYVPKDEFDRYGYQSALTFREQYRVGLASLDAYANSKFGKDYADLAEDQQDAIIDALAGTEGAGAKKKPQEKTGAGKSKPPESPANDFFKDPSASDFFKLVRDDVCAGMFADPAYGGNRGFAGWKLIGYPGAQRAYTPDELRTEGHGAGRQPQALADLPPFHAGQDVSSRVILPVSGSRHEH